MKEETMKVKDLVSRQRQPSLSREEELSVTSEAIAIDPNKIE